MKRKKLLGSMSRILAAVLLTAALSCVLRPVAAQAAIPSEYAAVFDAAYYAGKYPDVAAACGSNEELLLAHFINCGMAEGRQGNAEFDVSVYIANYPDLQAAFGTDLKLYYMHYMTAGKAEGRTAVAAPKPATTTTASDPTDKRNLNDQLRWDMQAAINTYRVNNDKVSLANTTEIIDAAQIRADELNKKYDRVRPDGRSGDSVLEDKNVPRHYFRELLYRSNNGSVSAVIDEWTKSNADVRNVLLYGEWRIIGVGHREVNGIHYWAIELTDNNNELKPGSSSESGNYLRERYKTPNEKEQDDEEAWLREYKRNHPDDDD